MEARKQKSHLEMDSKYGKLREVCYELTKEEFPGIDVRGITYADTLTADSWKSLVCKGARSHRSYWSWAEWYPTYQNKPKRFEITLSKGGQLGAICYGVLSVHNTRIRMNLIESTPVRPSNLEIAALPVLSFAAATFGDIVGAEELWVVDPQIGLEDIYMREGFGEREIFHGRRVGQRMKL